VTTTADLPQPDRAVVVDVEPVAPGALGVSAALAERLRAALAQGYQLILLNVADLTYCDSVTLGAIVQAYASAIRAGGTIKLLHVTTRFRELLVATKLDRVLQSADPEPGACDPERRL
jgi:anti-anti-sigma factor